MVNTPRVRIAPSPTGKLHIGTARTALFNYLYAKRMGGKFILRIEDTDLERSKPEYAHDIVAALRWLGIDWDEGPEVGGELGPYLQSERTEGYREYIDKIITEGIGYHCFCSTEELDAQREQAMAKREAYIYNGKCRNLDSDEVKARLDKGEKAVIRLKTPSKIVKFKDLIKGEIAVDSKTLGDFVLVKSDGTPLFLLASVLDDVAMHITHVIRGEDHISNTPKQILLLEALNLAIPEYAHLPLIVNTDRSKLSKRKNPTSISDDFEGRGYLPEAIVNFIAFMGWNPKDDSRQYFTLKELEQEWSLDNVGLSPAVFDEQRLSFLNGYYLRQMPIDKLETAVMPFVGQLKPTIKEMVERDLPYFRRVLAVVQEKLKTLAQIDENIELFYTKELDLKLETVFAKKLPQEKAKKLFEEIIETLESKEEQMTSSEAEELLRGLAEAEGIHAGGLLWAVRYLLSGVAASPGAFELMSVLKQETVIERLQAGLRLIDDGTK